MSQPDQSALQFARAVVRVELARYGATSSSDLTLQILKRFQRGLSEVFGPVGFDVLLARSVGLAQRDRPCLRELRAGPGGTLAGLAAAGYGGAAPQEVAVAIFSRLIEILIALLGEDLTLRLLREVAPGTLEASPIDDAA